METLITSKKNITIDIKTKEDNDYYYFYIFINEKEIKRFKGKDYYKTYDKAIEYLRYTFDIVII